MHGLIPSAVVLITLLLLLYLSVVAGHRFGERQIARHSESKIEVVAVAEGAVFTLLALLVAFAFSGAYDRFEERKLHIIEEANAVNTAYKRIDLLAPATQPALRESFRNYIDAQLSFYLASARLGLYEKELAHSKELETKIWDLTISACKTTNDSTGTVTQLFVPAVNNMFDEESAGLELTRIHPPAAIFILLIGLAMLSGFLAGYSTAEGKSKSSIHILCYVVITAFTIFIIINLEFPRVGIIRVDSFDKILINVRNEMQSPPAVNTTPPTVIPKT